MMHREINSFKNGPANSTFIDLFANSYITIKQVIFKTAQRVCSFQGFVSLYFQSAFQVPESCFHSCFLGEQQ